MRRKSEGDKDLYTNFLQSGQRYFSKFRVFKKQLDVGGRRRDVLFPVIPKSDSIYDEKEYARGLYQMFKAKQELDDSVSPDRFSYISFQKRACMFAYEGMPHRMVNDLIFDGCDLQMKYAHEYVKVGSVRQGNHDGLARFPIYEGDKVSIDQSILGMHNKTRQPGKGVVDFSMKQLKVLRIGGLDYTDRITDRGESDKRAKVYCEIGDEYQYDAGSHLALLANPNVQDEYAMELIESSSDCDFIGVIVSMVYLPRFAQKYDVVCALPAPYPSILSAYVVVSNRGVPFKFSNAIIFDLFVFMFERINYVYDTYRYGSRGVKDLTVRKGRPEEHGMMSNVIASWHNLLSVRFVKEPDVSWRIVENYEKFYVSNAQKIKLDRVTETTKRVHSELSVFRKRQV